MSFSHFSLAPTNHLTFLKSIEHLAKGARKDAFANDEDEAEDEDIILQPYHVLK